MLLAAVPAMADRAPDWLVAAAAGPMPATTAETDAVVLVDEMRVTIANNGDMYTVTRGAMRILRPKGKRFGEITVAFDDETKLTYLKAWSIDAKGQHWEVKEKDAVETSMLNDVTYSDMKHKVLNIPGADVGSVVGYEYQQKRRPYMYQDRWTFQSSIPARSSKFSLQLPPGWEYDVYWKNHGPVEPKVGADNSHTWELTDIPGLEYERNMPPGMAIAMVLNYYPSRNSNLKHQKSWSDVAAWSWDLMNPRRASTPEIRTRALALTASAATPLDKIRALGSFVQKDVRYVAIEIGIGGFQPHFASQTFTNRFGDCKDKATLLGTMLREVGIESESLLVHTDRGFVRPEIPSGAVFNHVISAIRVPENTPDLPAIVRHPKLGKLLIFDQTVEFTPVGEVPPWLQGSYGLLVLPKDGEPLQLPVHPARNNMLQRVAKLRLAPDGTLTGTVEETRSGAFAMSTRRRLLEQQGLDRSKVIENFLGTFLGSFQLTSAKVVNLENTYEPLKLQYAFTANSYAKVVGNLVLVPPRVVGSKSDDVLETQKKRTLPIAFEYPEWHADTFEIQVPAGWTIDEIPDPTELKFEGGRYKSTTEFADGVLRYQREYQFEALEVPVAKATELQSFYRRIAADERNSAVLKRF